MTVGQNTLQSEYKNGGQTFMEYFAHHTVIHQITTLSSLVVMAIIATIGLLLLIINKENKNET